MTKSISDLGVYIPTCDEMLFCLKPFCYLFNQYWPVKTTINVLGYANPNFTLPDSVKFYSLGEDKGAEHWSNDMLDFFSNHFEHEYFMLAPEDGFIIKKVDKDLLELALNYSSYIQKNSQQKFLRFGLTNCVSSRPHAVVQKLENSNIIVSNYGTDYRHSLQHSIWNRENFVKMLKPDMTPWQIELDDDARHDGMIVAAFSGNVPIHIGHGYSKGKKIHSWHQDVWRRLNGYGGLPIEHIKFIEENSWLPEIEPKVLRDGGGNVIKKDSRS